MNPRRLIRVAFLTGSLDLGGSERQMVAVATRLPRDRFAVEFLLLTHRGPLAAVAEAAGIPVHVIALGQRPAKHSYVRWGLKSMRVLAAVRTGHHDIVDAWLFQAYVAAAITRPLTRVPVLIAGRRSMSSRQKAEYGRDLRVLDELARRSVDAIVANSPQVRDDTVAYEHVDPSRIRVIRNGVEIPAAMPPLERTALREGWGFGPHDVVVGCVANFKLGKGLESLLRAAAALRPQMPTLRIVLVGEGPLGPLLELMVSDLGLADTVRLYGSAADARRLYGAFDIVVLASESEGLPNVLLEAAAAGRAIVATAAGGSVDVVIDSETGLLVPVRDPGALADAIRRLAGDAPLRDRLGLAARQRAETVFGMDRLVAETAALYEELAERRGVTTVGTRRS